MFRNIAATYTVPTTTLGLMTVFGGFATFTVYYKIAPPGVFPAQGAVVCRGRGATFRSG
jgi:hypothetical protein